MFSPTFLALLARLRWPAIDQKAPDELNALFAETALTLRQYLLKDDAEQSAHLGTGADMLLLAAFLEEREPKIPHYTVARQSLSIYGLSQAQTEAAAYAKILAMMRNGDVLAAIQQAVEKVPDLQRRRVGRPLAHEQTTPTFTVKKHLDLSADVVNQIHGNLTEIINEALLLWLQIGADPANVQ